MNPYKKGSLQDSDLVEILLQSDDEKSINGKEILKKVTEEEKCCCDCDHHFTCPACDVLFCLLTGDCEEARDGVCEKFKEGG